ncbi:hypothetical protein [Mucilaginibacter sp. dw_454]|uniref:hypothetical protein n=1 Tax=Mucilaginibacter sp. dw_454 TaxID=2720079 RepID=UPI001BD5CF30|nr:hypothetical protein [Mucilaginibacter sp. dw_454]
MSATKIKYLLFLALVMLVAKPFVGFTLRYEQYFRASHSGTPSILVKSFTKRKQEFSEDSEHNPVNISKKLADPALPVIALLALALNVFLPRLFKSVKATTHSALAAIIYSLYPPQPLYLLGGKLTI